MAGTSEKIKNDGLFSGDVTLPPDSNNAQAEQLAPTPAAILFSPGTKSFIGADPSTRFHALPCPFGRYVVEKKLGEGGMGAVFLARDTALARPVALKVPFLGGSDAAQIRARFLREAQSAAAVHHPHICPIHDVGEIDGLPFLTMTFITGEPLSRRFSPAQPLEVREALRLVRQLALAVQFAHTRGVIHRDLKPGNILIDERGEPVIMDFGLARRQDVTNLQLTQQGQLLGTPAYMSPEQFAGDTQAMGPACDIYSLGVVLYELLTGKTPFQGNTMTLMVQASLDRPPPPSRFRPEINPQLDAVCLKALEKEPAARWPSMQAFADALAALETAPQQIPVLAPDKPNVFPEASLSLRVEGTPFVYRPFPGLTSITVGRQKRAPGDPPEKGNDFVLRVAGDDQLTVRISRRHFEIHKHGVDYFVTDLSKVGTHLNGKQLLKNTPAQLKAGDRLSIAGVITLEVMIQQQVMGTTGPKLVQVSGPARQAQVFLEASMGDMMTME